LVSLSKMWFQIKTESNYEKMKNLEEFIDTIVKKRNKQLKSEDEY